MVTFNPSYASELASLARIVSPSGLMWGSSSHGGYDNQSYEIPFKHMGNALGGGCHFRSLFRFWRLNLIICCKGSIWLLYITNVGRRYHLEKGLMYCFRMQVHCPQVHPKLLLFFVCLRLSPIWALFIVTSHSTT